MIQYEDKEITKVYKEAKSITCDICGKTKNFNNHTPEIMEAQNYISIKKEFGYGSEIGDEDIVRFDICEQCFIDKFGLEFLQNHINNYN